MEWKGFAPVIPGNPKVKELIHHRERTFPCGMLTKPPKGICRWCFVNKNPTYRHSYCSKACQNSCYLFCYPQVYGQDYLKALQDYKCAHCEKSFRWEKPGDDCYCEVDHIIPIFKGGMALGWENIQLLCGPCHRTKTIEERRS